ncbi:MAG: GNAT family N-acetyltransferase [Cohaesibacteraceae bacterium]
MTLFRSLSQPSQPLFESERCFARAPEETDFYVWADLRSQSKAFLQPYEPRWPLDELTRPAFRRRLRRYAQDARDRQGYAFFIFNRDTETLMGGLTLSNIRYGVSQSCSLGYWMGEPYAGQGYMSEVLPVMFPFIFGELGMHRIEAACLPDNRASMRLLKSVGFLEEGLAKSYLKIDGRWQDHRLFAKITPL